MVTIEGTPTFPNQLMGDLTITTGSGQDAIGLRHANVPGKVAIALGTGAGRLTLDGDAFSAGETRTIDGGKGTDTLISRPRIGANNASFRNWEVFDKLLPIG